MSNRLSSAKSTPATLTKRKQVAQENLPPKRRKSNVGESIAILKLILRECREEFENEKFAQCEKILNKSSEAPFQITRQYVCKLFAKKDKLLRLDDLCTEPKSSVSRSFERLCNSLSIFVCRSLLLDTILAVKNWNASFRFGSAK